MITIPESVAFYLSDSTNRAAINILADRTDVPGDLTIDEVEQFEAASLSASRVRFEYWQLLRQLWSATWGMAVPVTFPKARLATFGEHQAFTLDPMDISVDFVWEEGTTYGLLSLPGVGQLVTSVWFADDVCREVGFGFYLVDAEGSWAVSESLDLGSRWTVDDGWQISEDIALDLDERGAIDTEPLQALVRAAVVALGTAVS